MYLYILMNFMDSQMVNLYFNISKHLNKEISALCTRQYQRTWVPQKESGWPNISPRI